MIGRLIVIVMPGMNNTEPERDVAIRYAREIRSGKKPKLMLVAGHGLILDWINFLIRFGMLKGRKKTQVARKLEHPANVYLLTSEVVGYEVIDSKLKPMKMSKYGLLSVSINQAIDDLERHLDAIDEVSP